MAVKSFAGVALLILSTVTHALGYAVGHWLTGGWVEKVRVGIDNGLYGQTPSSPAGAVVVLVLGPLFALPATSDAGQIFRILRGSMKSKA